MYVFSVMTCGGCQLLSPLPNADIPDAGTGYNVQLLRHACISLVDLFLFWHVR